MEILLKLGYQRYRCWAGGVWKMTEKDTCDGSKSSGIEYVTLQDRGYNFCVVSLAVYLWYAVSDIQNVYESAMIESLNEVLRNILVVRVIPKYYHKF